MVPFATVFSILINVIGSFYAVELESVEHCSKIFRKFQFIWYLGTYPHYIMTVVVRHTIILLYNILYNI